MTSVVIDQSRPKMRWTIRYKALMKIYMYSLELLSAHCRFWDYWCNYMAFTFKKWWISWKCALFIKKLPLFIKNSILHTYKKLKPQIWAFIKNSIFGTFRDPWPAYCPSRGVSAAQQPHEQLRGGGITASVTHILKYICLPPNLIFVNSIFLPTNFLFKF